MGEAPIDRIVLKKMRKLGCGREVVDSDDLELGTWLDRRT
jgi:hypothetical protein